MFLDIFEQTSYISRVHILQNLKGVITRNLRHITTLSQHKGKILNLKVNGLSQSLHCTQVYKILENFANGLPDIILDLGTILLVCINFNPIFIFL